MKTIFVLSMLLTGVANAYDTDMCLKILNTDPDSEVICSAQNEKWLAAAIALTKNPRDPNLLTEVEKTQDAWGDCRTKFVRDCEKL